MKVSINPLTKKKGLVFKTTVQAVQFSVTFSAEEQAKIKALGIRKHALLDNVPFKSGAVMELTVGMLDSGKAPYEAHFENEGDAAEFIEMALLHKSGFERTSPFPGRTYPMCSVMGMPRAV